MQIQTTSTNSATYWSADDLDQIRSQPVRVIVEYILKTIAGRGISFRSRVRNPYKAQLIKIRSIETNSELVFITNRRNDDAVTIRFIEHADRYTTTATSRLVVRQIHLDFRQVDALGVHEFINNELIRWLTPTAQNLKPALIPMLVLENVDHCPSALVAIGFTVTKANIVAKQDQLTVNIQNHDGSVVRNDRKIPDIVLNNPKESLVGRIYVEFHNGDYLFMTEKIFVQQFEFFHSRQTTVEVPH